MPPLPVLLAKQLISAVECNDFERKRQRGRHITMQHAGGRITVVPNHRWIAKGTPRAIMRDTRLAVTDLAGK